MFDFSITGIRQNLERLEMSARRIADAENADLAKEFTDMIIAEKGAKANIAALRTSMSLHKSIIDLLA